MAAIALADSSGDQPRPDSATSLPNPLGTAGDSGRLADVGDGQPVGAIVTLLFTDVVDSTGLRARLGTARADALFDAHFRLVAELLTTFDGEEVKRLGTWPPQGTRSEDEPASDINRRSDRETRQRQRKTVFTRKRLMLG